MAHNITKYHTLDKLLKGQAIQHPNSVTSTPAIAWATDATDAIGGIGITDAATFKVFASCTL